MSCTEFWLTYQFASRTHLPLTTQLIELDVNGARLCDLEDVLDHVFRQGYVEAKYRPVSWWERKDGVAVKASQLIEDLVKVGVGKTPEGALKLVVDDLPTALWFSYVYVHAPASHRVVTQRIKIHELPPKACDRLAHITNHIFAMGWLPAKLRTVVHWQKSCGFKLEETACVKDLLVAGDGVEGRCLKLVIDAAPTCAHGCPCHPAHGNHSPIHIDPGHHHHYPHSRPHTPHTPHTPHSPHHGFPGFPHHI